MKKVLLPLASVALLATSCIHDDEIKVNFDSQTEIRPSASISARSLTRGIETGNKFANDGEVFAVTAINGTNDYFTNLVVSQTGSTYAFAQTKYFPSDGSTVNFYAYSPIVKDAGYDAAARTVSWTLDGTQDILWAKHEGLAKASSGNTQGQPEFNLAHQLALFEIHIAKGEGFSDNISVTKMEVLDVTTGATLDLKEGTMAYAADKNTLTVPTDASSVTNVSTGGIYGSILLPATASYKLRITTTGNVTYPDVTISATEVQRSEGPTTSYNPGEKYEVHLTFTGTAISTSASITPWTAGGSVAQTVQ